MNHQQNAIARKGQGFTLIELLMVISVIAVLSTLALVVLRDAQETARHARSASIAAQCRTALQQKLETFETRTLPFSVDQIIPGANLAHRQHLRRRTVMEWVHKEMPHRWEFVDLSQEPSEYSYPTSIIASNTDSAWHWPDLWKNSFRDYFTSRPTSGFKAMLRARVASATATNQQAELLYAILQNTWINDARGTDFLGAGEVTDTDVDNCREVVDAWGEPLIFFIWVDSNQNGIFDGPSEELVLATPPNATTGLPFPPELKDIHVFVGYQRANQY